MKNEPVWIRDDVVFAIHRRQIAEHGGLDGIRDESLLKSALGKPRNMYIYGEPLPSIAALAASYAYGIIKNHPFIDGNKRTAFVVCLLFLQLNGIILRSGQKEKYEIFLHLAEGKVSESDFAEWIEENI